MRLRGLFFILVGFIFILVWGDNASAIENNGKVWLQYEPNISELSGMLKKEKKYGPPNYGETPHEDKLIEVWMIRLDLPINVKGDGNSQTNTETIEGIKEIQLVLPDKIKDVNQFTNQKVKVKGGLFQAVSGHHFTKVLIHADEIQVWRRTP